MSGQFWHEHIYTSVYYCQRRTGETAVYSNQNLFHRVFLNFRQVCGKFFENHPRDMLPRFIRVKLYIKGLTHERLRFPADSVPKTNKPSEKLPVSPSSFFVKWQQEEGILFLLGISGTKKRFKKIALNPFFFSNSLLKMDFKVWGI